VTIREVLIKARAVLAKPEAWTRGWYARAADGRKVPANSEAATCWCMAGAVKRAAGPDATEALLNGAEFALARETRTKYLDTFNDNPRHSHADILRVFDRALAAEGFGVRR